LTSPPPAGSRWMSGPVALRALGDYSVARLSKVEDDGAQNPPCLEMRFGSWRVPCPVEAGARTISISVRHNLLNPPPRLRVAANPDLGVAQDVIAEAQNRDDWHQIQVTVTVSRRGVLEVYLENLDPMITEHRWARWDDLQVT